MEPSTAHGRKLSTVNNGKNIRYFYDHTGRRVRKTVDVTTYFSYDSAGNLIGMSAGGKRYFYTRNAQNDITGLIDESGKSVVQYQYDSWGKLLGITGSLASTIGKRNPFRYRGYYYDDETGMYYIKNRYYDSDIKRFICSDDTNILIGDYENFAQYNLYVYCFNNPINLKDEEGMWPKWATKVLIGAAAIAVGAVVVGATCGAGVVGHRVLTGSWKGAGKSALNGAADGFMWGGIAAGSATVRLAVNRTYVSKIGRLKPSNKKGNGYMGVRYGVRKKSGNFSYRFIELHSPHKGGPHQIWHWQKNSWSYNEKIWTMSSKKHWSLWGRRI